MHGIGVLVVVVASLLVAACSSRSETSPLALRLQACGIVTAGELNPPLFYAPNACYEDCLAGATCDELRAAACSESITLLTGCDEQCAYRCPDGALIAIEAVCNGFEECEGGADEASCTGEPCTGRVPDAWQCDGLRQCRDGRDEWGCPVELRCPSGETMYPWDRCDGYERCSDGSDEAGCAEVIVVCE